MKPGQERKVGDRETMSEASHDTEAYMPQCGHDYVIPVVAGDKVVLVCDEPNCAACRAHNISDLSAELRKELLGVEPSSELVDPPKGTGP